MFYPTSSLGADSAAHKTSYPKISEKILKREIGG